MISLIERHTPGSNPLYTVTQGTRSPLTTEEQQLFTNSQDPDHPDFINMERKTKPWSGDQVRGVLNKTFKTKPIQQQQKKAEAPTTPKPKIPPLDVKVNEEEKVFGVNWEE